MSSRDKLIEAAITLFSERGYEGTSITDLVEETGANASLVSYHFGGKRGLLEAALHKLAHDKLVHAKSLLGKCETEADRPPLLVPHTSRGFTLQAVKPPELVVCNLNCYAAVLYCNA